MAGKKMVTISTMHSRYSDRSDFTSKGHIAKLALSLACVLIVLASVSLTFIGLVASREADRQASSNQQLLLDSALNYQFALMARDQLSLARWDTSVLKISQNFDRDFVIDEFMDSLWFDFGLDRSLLVGPDNKVLAESFEDDVRFNTRQLTSNDPLYQIVERARAAFFIHRITIPGGFGQQLISSVAPGTQAAQGFFLLDDQVVMANAMAIVPDDGVYALAEGNPVVLVSAIHLGKDFLADLNDQLSFSDLTFIQLQSSSSDQPLHKIISPSGEVLGAISWHSAMPGQQIWRTVIPVIVVLATFLALVAIAIAWKIGQLTRSLATSEQHNFHLAMHDTLSGLANRLQFKRVLTTALKEDIPTTPFTLIQGDLDRFKKVNDTLGHAAGDTVIKTVAHRLTEAVGSAGLVSRVGGDEFVIFLPDCVERSRVKELADKIIAAISLPVETENGEFAEVGISLGIAFAPDNGSTSESIMAAADGALYMAKDLGRNRAIFADDVSAKYQ
ncbi:MAG: diguanylate cyclase [Proteobacteria bacterium]|nr:diguanylate cyclase [Pseudomonadota bacterium]